MLEVNRLCIDPGDGSPALEYRLEDDRVVSRIVEPVAGRSGDMEKPWKAVTSEELSSHVTSGTVVAQWLQRRMGYRRLLRACIETSSFANETLERSHPKAA